MLIVTREAAVDEVATRLTRPVLPEPILREWFDFPLSFSSEQGDKLRRGHIPLMMEDRWFVFYENGWLYFCRNWTGASIFGLRLTATPDGMVSSECWASRDPEHYHCDTIASDKALLKEIICFILEYDPSNAGW